MLRYYRLPVILIVLLMFFVSLSHGAKIKHIATLYSDDADMALKHPESVACTDQGLLVADSGNNRLVRFQLSAQGIVANAVFPLPGIVPLVVQQATDGSVLVLDGKKRQLLRLDRAGRVQGELTLEGIPAPEKYVPRSFKLDSEDNIYLMDILSGRLLVFTPDGKYLRTIPVPEESGFISDLAVSRQGAVYLLDSVGGAIYRADPGSDKVVVLNHDLKDYANFPIGLAIAGNGELYVTDQYGSGLIAVGTDGSFRGRKFGMGWEDGQLYYPAQLCISLKDDLVVADRNNSRVQVFQILED